MAKFWGTSTRACVPRVVCVCVYVPPCLMVDSGDVVICGWTLIVVVLTVAVQKLCGWSRCLGVGSSDWELGDSCGLGWLELWPGIVVFGILLSNCLGQF